MRDALVIPNGEHMLSRKGCTCCCGRHAHAIWGGMCMWLRWACNGVVVRKILHARTLIHSGNIGVHAGFTKGWPI